MDNDGEFYQLFPLTEKQVNLANTLSTNENIPTIYHCSTQEPTGKLSSNK